TIWATAAVGVALGIEAYIVAIFGSLFAITLLELRVFTKNIRPSTRGGGWNEDEDDDGRPERRARGATGTSGTEDARKA
ncbi:MAG TPA: MgtC/SapB family protein, partial [Dehalococcoidia bacterium]|nr:MgtC/SapB family protein [Dehalococcoidia bacterium]